MPAVPLSDPRKLLTLEEVAVLLDCGRSTVLRRISAGELPVYRGSDRRRIYVCESDVEKLAKPKPGLLHDFDTRQRQSAATRAAWQRRRSPGQISE